MSILLVFNSGRIYFIWCIVSLRIFWMDCYFYRSWSSYLLSHTATFLSSAVATLSSFPCFSRYYLFFLMFYVVFVIFFEICLNVVIRTFVLIVLFFANNYFTLQHFTNDPQTFSEVLDFLLHGFF